MRNGFSIRFKKTSVVPQCTKVMHNPKHVSGISVNGDSFTLSQLAGCGECNQFSCLCREVARQSFRMNSTVVRADCKTSMCVACVGVSGGRAIHVKHHIWIHQRNVSQVWAWRAGN